MTNCESTSKARISWLAVVSFIIALIWYAGWGLTLGYGLLTYDMQGWNWLPYIVWGMWGLPVMILSLILGLWSLWCIRKRSQQLKGQMLAWVSTISCLPAAPIWYGTSYVVVLLRQL